jgi:anti-sigma regulatory factor (Ser/Thr protein kinase)
VASVLSGCPPDVRDTLLLAVSEAVTNAVRHGSGDVALSVALNDDHVHVEVSDAGAGWSHLGRLSGHATADGSANGNGSANGDGLAEGGRGLPLIAALTDAWGARARAGAPGTTVWFDVRLPTG